MQTPKDKKKFITYFFSVFNNIFFAVVHSLRYNFLYIKYKKFTMISRKIFVGNLRLCSIFMNVPGCVVECGVWRGGMSAAIGEALGRRRKLFLFDSFEGLPQATEIDGEAALSWQKNTASPIYLDNCKTEILYAEEAMRRSRNENYRLIRGWFNDTLPNFKPTENIAILRLDGDWYASTMQCLENLYFKVAKGGVIIIDDYYMWDGCAKAVHDFLSKKGLADRIEKSKEGVCYIIKNQ